MIGYIHSVKFQLDYKEKVMSDTVETIKIADAKAPGGYVVINADEFDPKKQKEWVEPVKAEAKDDKSK